MQVLPEDEEPDEDAMDPASVATVLARLVTFPVNTPRLLEIAPRAWRMSAMVGGFVSAMSGDSGLEASGVESEALSSGSKLSVSR